MSANPSNSVTTHVASPNAGTSERPVLFVIWQAPEQRGYHVVGCLFIYGEGEHRIYEFAYVNEYQRATQHGFRPFIAFPEVEYRYQSETLFPLFTNRLMSRKRRDFPDHIRQLGLNPDQKDLTPELILSRSGGRRVTDRIELFAPPVLDPDTRTGTMYCLLRGLRYVPSASEQRVVELAAGEPLFGMLDFQNPYNPNAIAVRSEDNHFLGYLPDYLTRDLITLRQYDPDALALIVERVNPPPAPRDNRLLIRMQARWPEGVQPFDDDRFRPVVEISPKERMAQFGPAVRASLSE